VGGYLPWRERIPDVPCSIPFICERFLAMSSSVCNNNNHVSLLHHVRPGKQKTLSFAMNQARSMQLRGPLPHLRIRLIILRNEPLQKFFCGLHPLPTRLLLCLPKKVKSHDCSPSNSVGESSTLWALLATSEPICRNQEDPCRGEQVDSERS
jgi:hypothetical protein